MYVKFHFIAFWKKKRAAKTAIYLEIFQILPLRADAFLYPTDVRLTCQLY